MSQEQFETLLRFFKVLGNESRLKILGLLANDERSVGELAVLLNLREPTISHHLAAMKELGLVEVRAEGNNRIYWLNSQFLEGMSKDMFSQTNLATLVDDEETSTAWEEKVLRVYMDGNRIKQIPSKRKKERVILQWLADQFEMDRQYYELDLNEIIKQFHPDASYWRRALVVEKFMARDDRNMYWRLPQSDV
ncbi:MAG: metalloregulator ArsR/SmtB family transcription factor [Chloroflexi bacterium]|nr:metalloregulator ArsR/SmtB family transcription factor [Chloroflexota bacterium]